MLVSLFHVSARGVKMNGIHCRLLRYVGDQQACVLLSDTGAVINVLLPRECVESWEQSRKISAASTEHPCEARMTLKEYVISKRYHTCSEFSLLGGGPPVEMPQGRTTQYKRVCPRL